MRIRLEYTAQLRRAAGRAHEDLELPDQSSLSQALRLAASRHSEEFQKLLLSAEGEAQASLLIFHQDRQVRPGDDPALADGATVTVMSPISGG